MKTKLYKGDAVKATKSKNLIEILIVDGWTTEELVGYSDPEPQIEDAPKRRGRPSKFKE